MIVSRIVYAAFEGNIEDIIQKMPSSANDSLLYGVLKIISMKLHEQYKSTEIIPLVLAFDEYQLATRHISGLHTTIQHKLGWYMRHVQFQHQILLFPAFAGTLNENDAKMEPTQYTPATLPLPSLRSIDIQEIMQDLGLSALYERNREFWNAIGVVPRHLQWALEGYDVKKQELQNMVDIFNEDTVISSIYYNVTNTVQRQYGSDLQKPTDYFVELALRTLSGLSETEQDDRITKYIREGKVYDTNDFVGLPLVVIDILATKKDCIPKQVVTDFITATSKKPRWEIFEEVCIKTMTARFNVLYTVNKSTTVPFSRLFKGAHFAKMGRILLETTNDEWFRYCCLDSKISDSNGNANNELLTLNHLAKTKKNHKDIDGVFCPLINVNTGKRIVFVVQNKFQQEDSEKTLLSPGEIVEYYENAAKTPFENSETFVIIFTNKKISKSTRDMIEKGKITTTKEKKELVVATDKLIVVSGDCFDNFFHPFVANILLGGQ
ncbi:hypothetical protein C9374_010818 [Naegleria lovaniensis]|uniref:Uncharacterized protein n=1 Tax=Naegleria lovaniensis TaxID=51637 RepID=A0AA88GH78_NAELO|nr:uncharacterized protein C9374_010818 [Naegleria lovaniensis]KAG2374534.1 hypothetical protein C9374_010818 [Naegleria lovaniensis]